MLVTGQFDLVLYNVAGKGRNYELHWQRFNQFSQNLNISALEPLLFGSGIDLKASFSLLKEDSTFLARDFRLDFGYRLGPGSYVRFFNRRQAGDLLAVSDLSDATELPEVGDFRFNNYGLGFEHSWLDDRFFPRRGAFTGFEFALGNKNILVNTAIPPNLYENIDLSTIQYYLSAKVEKYFYGNQRLGLLTRLSGGLMENPNLFVNDLFRLGGLKTIRGFNENFFFANNYIYLNIEPRYYFDTYSYFMIFADMGRLENQVQNLKTDYPFSMGIGFSLETGSGIFNFIYALGGSNAQEFALNLSKIHFGYTGRF
jgi:outer membrane protein assembly factor BamA